MTLLTAMLVSEPFRNMVQNTGTALELFFDESLYKTNSERSTRANFLDRLLIAQLGNPAQGLSPVPLLDRFAADVVKLSVDEGLPQENPVIRDSLFIAAMEYYYFKDAASATGLFTVADGGIHFRYSDIGASRYKSLIKLKDAVLAMLDDADKSWVAGLIKQDAWHIQSGSDPLNWATDNIFFVNDTAIGGAVANDEGFRSAA